MAAGVAVLGAEVSVRAAPAPAGKAVHLALSVMMGANNAAPSGLKTTWWATCQRIGAASVTSTMFWFTVVVIFGAVWARGLPLCGGVQVGPLLQKFS